MRKWMSAFTLIELLVVIAIIAILAGMLLPILARAREEARRGVCSNQIGQLGKAQQAYMSTNGDFWSFQQQHRWTTGGAAWNPNNNWWGQDPTRGYRAIYHNSSLSLSVLYPRWVDDVNIFKCPSTADQPIIGKLRLFHQGPLYSWFFSHHTVRFAGGTAGNGYHIKAPDPGATLPNLTNHNVQIVTMETTGRWNNGQHGTSYGYDDIKHYRNMLPGSARIADMRWMDSTGNVEHSNHGLDGHNVLYWDGSVAFRDTNYASVNPQDNIFARDGWSGSAYTVDIENDAVIVRTQQDAGRGVNAWW